MSDSSQGPGWWMDTDGKWYPPRPDGEAPLPPTEPVDDLIITPMSDPDVPPVEPLPPAGEPTMVIPAMPVTPPAGTPPIAGPTAATVVPVTDPPPPAPWYKENWWVIAVVAVLLAALIVGIILWTGDDDGDEEVSGVDSTLATSLPSSTVPESTAPASTAPATTVPETTEAATTTVAPTTEPATTTVAPTTVAPTTVAPTTVAPTTAAPTTTVAPPPPTIINGVGDDTRQISIPGGGLGVANITNDGQTNFEVLALDENENLIEDVVVTIGPYEGSVVLPEGTNFLEITAEGAWTVEVMAPAAAPAFDGEEAAGSGDMVLRYAGSGGTASITHDGEELFMVRTYLENGTTETLVDEDGPVDLQVEMLGPALVQVTADGDWTISVN